MRGFILIMIIVGFVPVILAKPYVGALVWSWISYMNPHRLVYDGGAWSFPIAMIVAVVTVAAWIFSRQPKNIPWSAPVIILVIFTLWITLTTFLSSVGSTSTPEWIETLKVLLMTFVMASVINSRKQLNLLIWVIALSIGYYGVRGGLFVVWTGGGYLVWGPPNSYIAANNAIGMALLMVIPLLRYLQLQVSANWVKWSLVLAMLLSSFAVLGTHSRGALLGAAAMAIAIWFKSRRKVVVGIGLVISAGIALSLFPQEWWDRMRTIESYDQDTSANVRLEMWQFAIDIANDNLLFGGGFEVWGEKWLHQKYDVAVDYAASVHSIYFQVLGEHGYIGLITYLLIGFLTYRTGSKLIVLVRDKPQHRWAGELASMVQVSLVGFAVGGAFLNKAYFDLYFHFVVIMALSAAFVKRSIEEENMVQPSTSTNLPGTPPRSHHYPKPIPGTPGTLSEGTGGVRGGR